ncbi:MAG: glycine cleavage system protein GcvH [Gammaproteobacteria bacterium]|jgi:glycine cleavage system H protein
MSEIPSELKYTKSHEWVRDENDGSVTVGITDHAQALLGDLVFVELPEIGTEMSAEDAACVVESVKAASDVYMPVSGEVIAVNEELADAPETINDSPYDDGWLIKIKLSNPDELSDLMDADSYEVEAAED